MSRTADPTADLSASEGKKGKKVGRADARDSRNVPAELMSKFRPEPEVELLDDGALLFPCSRPLRFLIFFHRFPLFNFVE